MNLSFDHSIMKGQNLASKNLTVHPIILKYILLQKTALREILNERKCSLSFGGKDMQDPKVSGYEKNVSDFQNDFNEYVNSLNELVTN